MNKNFGNQETIGASMLSTDTAAKQFNHNCPSCHSRSWHNQFPVEGYMYQRCQTCGVLTTDPFPDETDLERFYSSKNQTGDFYSRDMTRWLGLRERIFGRYLDTLVKQTGFSLAGANVLDIGCFNGASLNIVTRRGGIAHGMERQAESVNHLQERYPGRVYHQDACKFDAALSGRFDLITMTDVIEHVLDPATLLKNASCWLKDEGLVFLTTPNSRSFTAMLMGKNWPSLLPVHHVYLFDRRSLTRVLEMQGLTIVASGILTKHLSIGYFVYMLSRFKNQFSFIEKLTPRFLSNVSLPFFGGEMYVIVRKLKSQE